MKRILLISLFVVSLSLLITCETQPPVTYNYFPNKDQSEWKYIDKINNTEYVYKLNGTAVHEIYGNVQVLEITYLGIVYTRYIQLVDEDNDGKTDIVIFFYTLDTDERVELLRYPVTVGKTWSWKVGELTNNAVVKALETVEVPLGKYYNCPKIQYSTGGQVFDVMWYADGVGMIRDALETNYDIQLESYTDP